MRSALFTTSSQEFTFTVKTAVAVLFSTTGSASNPTINLNVDTGGTVIPILANFALAVPSISSLPEKLIMEVGQKLTFSANANNAAAIHLAMEVPL